ncbi:aminoglycoside phosphotransferase (APT) family kinase protein [Methanofollis sp. W23]|nr:aminoglycoside phosphotransferase (APT) family kinase protein [Methanofollis sp. W23]
MDLMKNVEPSFQHDDYHPANIIVDEGTFGGVIDFNRCDWGDPIHDFYKTALFSRNVSVPFSVGQIDGYNGGNVPDEFWKKYSLYAAMSIVPDIVWSYRYSIHTGTSEQIERSQRTIRTILSDHEGFELDVPLWYRELKERA